MLRRFWDWLFAKKHKPIFVPVRGDSLARVEELPSGRLVLYVDVSDVPSNRVESYMCKVKKDLKDAL